MFLKGEAESFAAPKEKYGLTESIDLGLRTVPVANVVGSVNRWRDFDARFRIKNPSTIHRYKRIKQAVEKGKIMPPVILYKVREKYYVVDGNHRISVAKEVGQAYIDAEVIEFFPAATSEVNLIWRERSAFEHKTGLAGIEFTELGSYEKLLMQIRDFQKEESNLRGYELTLMEASLSWLEESYKPVVALIRKERLLDEFPNRTEADLFLYASYHKIAKARLTKQKVGYKEALADFRVKQPQKTFKEQLIDLITSLFAPEEDSHRHQELIFDEDGLIKLATSDYEDYRQKSKKGALIISDDDKLSI